MRLEILRNLAVPLPDFREGDVRDVEDELADSLVKRGLAVHTDKPATPLDAKTGQRKVEAPPQTAPAGPVLPRSENIDTDAPDGGTSRQATMSQAQHDKAKDDQASKRKGQ